MSSDQDTQAYTATRTTAPHPASPPLMDPGTATPQPGDPHAADQRLPADFRAVHDATAARSRTGFVGLLVAEFVSLIGSRMSVIAIPWLVLVTTGSATRTGIVAAAEMLPYVVVTAAGAPLIDRIGARRTSIVMNFVSAIPVAAIPLMYHFHALAFGLLITLVIVVGSLRGLGDTAESVIFPDVAARAGTDMSRAASINDGVRRAAGLVGAPIGGVLVGVMTAANVIYIDALSFLVAGIMITAFIARSAATAIPAQRRDAAEPRTTTDQPRDTIEQGATGPRPPATPATSAAPGGTAEQSAVNEPIAPAAMDQPRESYGAMLTDGWRFMRSDRLLLGISILFSVTNLFDAANGVFTPLWACESYGSAVGIGLVSAAFTAGAVIANIAYTALAPKLPRYAPFVVGLVLGGAPRFIAMGLDSPVAVILVVTFAAGVGMSVINPILGATLYERVPERYRARVYGLGTGLAWLGIPLGAVLGGALADAAGLRTALLVTAAGYLGASLVPLLGGRVWRGLDRPTDPEQVGPGRA